MAIKQPIASRFTEALAELFPAQGEWTEDAYLALDTNRIVELSDGNLEIHDMPTYLHQLILGRLFLAVSLYLVNAKIGRVAFSPLPVRLWPGKIREPDLVFMSATHRDRIGNQFWGVPDLVAEVVSESNPNLDRKIKKDEYAKAGVPEYWIVDPVGQTVEVYKLEGEIYTLREALQVGDTLISSQLPGFSLELAELFAEE